jgi:hypothetical protein
MSDDPSLFDPVAGPVARKTDPPGSQAAADKAWRSMGKHKKIVLHIMGEFADLTPQECARTALARGFVELPSLESVRRRVSDLWRDGKLIKTGEVRDDAEVYALPGSPRWQR